MPADNRNYTQQRGFGAQFGRAAAGGWSDVTSIRVPSDANSEAPPPRVRVDRQASVHGSTSQGQRDFREGLRTERRTSVVTQSTRASEYRRAGPTPSPASPPPAHRDLPTQLQVPVSSARAQPTRVGNQYRNNRAERPARREVQREEVQPGDSVSNVGDSVPLEDRLAELAVTRRDRRPSERTTHSSHKSKRSVYSSEGSNYSVEFDDEGNRRLVRHKGRSGNVRNSLGYLLT